MNTETINAIAKATGVAADQIIPHYARWYLTAGIGYTLLGLCLMCIAWLMFKYRTKLNDEWEFDTGFIVLLAFGVAVFGAVMVIFNFADIVSPTGIAIHKLLKDIRG